MTKKPPPPPAKSRTPAIVGGIVVLVAAAVALTLQWVWQQDKTDNVIRVEVHLDNRCELVDDAFMAVVEPGGPKGYFVNGVAVLQAPAGSRIRVRGSDRYPDFSFPGTTEPAAPKVVVTTRCGDRVDQVMDAMREQFRKQQR